MKIAIATCLDIPEPDFDEPFILEALADAGHHATAKAWDDPSVDWAAFDACIVRSTWNYYRDPTAFVAWINRVDALTTLGNPAHILVDNIDKRYLDRLEAHAIPVIPTEWIDRDGQADLAEIIDRRGWHEVGVVIKPTISAGSWKTKRFETTDTAKGQAFLDDLASERDVMIQRFMPSVARGGERSLVRLGTTFTHAIEKKPRFDGEDESVSDALPIGETQRALAERILEVALGDARHTLTYARVDLIADDAGDPMLSELELLEPSLFLKQAPAARSVFAAAVSSLESR